MLRVGLTGGYATGKSHVGELLAGFGCHLIRADDLGHQVLAPGAEAYAAVIEAFAGSILKEDGSIDRKALGAIVFRDPDKLAALNALVHPPVWARQERLIQEFEKTDPGGIVIVEAAIHFETGGCRMYQKMIVTVCGAQEQIRRAMARDGLGGEKVLDRIRRQMPLEEKARLADFVIDTSGTREETRRQTRLVWEQLRTIKAA